MPVLMHYGILRRSGRYPWGSGENPYQRSKDFYSMVDALKAKGLSDKEIAEGFGMNTTQLRQARTIARTEKRRGDMAEALRLKDKGLSNTAIGERMGINESSVRNLLKPALQERADSVYATSNMLKDAVDSASYVDIGAGVERYMGVSRTKLKTAVSVLEDQGYKVYYLKTKQLGTGEDTSLMVLAKPGVEWSEVNKNKANIQMPVGQQYTNDGGKTFTKIEPPRSISSNRVYVRYNEDGGKEKDGVIELRPGVDELSLGRARYAQVRIAVDGTHYLKGMAMYSNDIPDGYDVVFNTNKHKGTPKIDTFKKMKDDPENPFGANIRQDDELVLAQRHYKDKNGKTQQSALNIIYEEGNWNDWSRSLSSQFLSKQSPSLAKKQLGLAYDSKKEEFDEIMSLTNPAVKKKLLESFADDCDSSAVHLKGAALPRQSTNVILPFPGLKENEIYAPNYRDGERVVLIRHPHGGPFEIPELTVNNRYKPARDLIGNAIDAVGINSKVAERLSGADFDGDNVLTIPVKNVKIKTKSPLKELENFDPKEAYPGYDGMKVMTPHLKGVKMGDVSNLITDMTIKGATDDEIARAVRHSMVVIDAEKHKLNYKQSYADNGIAELKKKYQGRENAGASTLISRASSQANVPEREEGILITDPVTGRKRRQYIDPNTGEKLYTPTGSTYTRTYTTKSGEVRTKVIQRTTRSTKMAEAKDAYELSSGTLMESIYADHANKLKTLGNQARKGYTRIQPTKYSPSAKKAYASEVESLRSKLNVALKNAPLERKAQLIANAMFQAKKEANPDMDKDQQKKEKGRCLTTARSRVGAGKQRIDITEREWQAIQAGAISNNTLNQIINNTDLDKLKQLATPRTKTAMTDAKLARAKSMAARGYTTAEIADALGVSTSTVTNAMHS